MVHKYLKISWFDMDWLWSVLLHPHYYYWHFRSWNVSTWLLGEKALRKDSRMITRKTMTSLLHQENIRFVLFMFYELFFLFCFKYSFGSHDPQIINDGPGFPKLCSAGDFQGLRPNIDFLKENRIKIISRKVRSRWKIIHVSQRSLGNRFFKRNLS